MKNTNYLYDENHVRYELYYSGEGKNYNWLFFPGGPGADSSYLNGPTAIIANTFPVSPSRLGPGKSDLR